MDHTADTLTAKDLGLGDNVDDVLDVLDLPQLYTKPNARLLLTTLADLSSAPASWEATPRTATPLSPLSGASTPYRKKRKIKSEGVPSYLTKIVASSLEWLENDDEKEQVWEAASQRLSERSGRTALGDISRNFVIPLSEGLSSFRDHSTGTLLSDETTPQADMYLDLTLHEPALTGDSLGLKTWASSYLLAKRMPLLQTRLPLVPSPSLVLELGSGTGLVGLAAAAILHRHVILTDLPDIVPNLERNATANADSLGLHEGKATCAILDWSRPEKFHLDDSRGNYERHTFPLVLAADPLYSAEHPRLLVQAIEYHLSAGSDARVVVELPLRDAYLAERDDFRARMKEAGLVVLEEGEEVGFDDWSTGSDDEPLEVRCWWSVWGRE